MEYENISKNIFPNNKEEIAIICVHILILPNWFAATTSPSFARIKRRSSYCKFTANN